jgi:hypothetical protein
LQDPPKFTQIGFLVWTQTIWQHCNEDESFPGLTSNSIHQNSFSDALMDVVLVQTSKNWKNIPNGYKLYQTAINYTKWP